MRQRRTARATPMLVHSVIRLMSVIALAAGGYGIVAATPAAAETPRVMVGRIDGGIDPITARYVDRLIAEGEGDAGVRAVVFVIDTPGGLIDSTYKITARMLNARVPVVTYVGPSGARAASAGAFITLAGHVAAMAPATNIGAAHPVDSSGGDIEGDLRAKVENDAVAQITKIAIARGRNAEWAEQAVRQSVSIRDDEALRLRVVDLIAPDTAELLARIDGRAVVLPHATVRLATAGVPLDESGKTPFEAILDLIVDPQIAVLLFTIGTYGIIFELSNPSLIFPGVVGVIAIILALFAIGSLDGNAAGIALMVFAVALFVAEIWVPSHGILTVGGIVALVIGTIIVFPPWKPTFPGVRASVHPLVIALIAGGNLVFLAFLVRASRRYLHLPAVTGAPLLVGASGVAKSDLQPAGIVHVAGEDWTATSEGGPIEKGAAVTVRRVDALRLIVERDVSGPGSAGAAGGAT